MISQGGFYIFTIWDTYTGGFPLLVIGLFEILTLTYIYGYKNFADDISMMTGRKPFIIFRIAWSAVTPLVILAVIIFTAVQYKPTTLFSGYDLYEFPSWAEGIGWLIVSLCLVFIPAGAIYQIVTASKGKKFSFQIIKDLCKPLETWGPADKRNRTGRYAKLPTYTEANGQTKDVTAWTVTSEGVSNPSFEDDANNNTNKTDIEMERM